MCFSIWRLYQHMVLDVDMCKEFYIVYMHKNKINNKLYIGITGKKPQRRWGYNGHGYSNNTPFHYAITKYGWDNFEHKILIHGLTKEQALRWEVKLIQYHRSNNSKFGYNLTCGGELNIPVDSVRQKISKTKIGGKNPRSKKVICLFSDKIFDSVMDCCRYYKVNPSTVQYHCNKKTKVLLYLFLEDYNQLNSEEKLKLRDLAIEKKTMGNHGKFNGMYNKKGEDNPCYGRKFPQRSGKNNPMYGKTGLLCPTYGKEPWNKGKKCPQLTGENNGMFGLSDSHPRAKKVVRLVDGVVYPTILKCSQENNVHVDTIRLHCQGKVNVVKYLYFDDYERGHANE